MHCEDIHELAPLWRSGELEAGRRKAFESHVAGCPACAAELRGQNGEDERLRAALASEQVNAAAVERRVMRTIRRERILRFAVPALAVAAILIAAVVIRLRPVPNPAAQAIFADAARDHKMEVIDQAPRRWHQPADLAGIETSQGLTDADVKALEAKGYHLEHAKICRLGKTPYVHVVYTKAGHKFSLYLRVRGDRAVSETESNAGNLELVSFAPGRMQAVVVTDAPHGDCAQFEHDAKSVL